MPHVVIAPDSYKGSASAREVARALGEGLSSALPGARLTCSPMADGGEGTLDCVAASIPGRMAHTRVRAIHGHDIDARWYRSHDNRGFIESAEVLGLPLMAHDNARTPLGARGSAALGALIRGVLDAGIHELFIGLGGSACNDAGLGLLIALGATAADRRGTAVAPTMAGLLTLDALDLCDLDPRLAHTPIHVLCDVDNPLLGARGASRVYGPQKGLSATDIKAVEAAFARLADLASAQTLAQAASSGAAGGLGFALARIGGQLHPGANTLIEMAGLRRVFADADLIITGEGRSDSQTLSGKLPLAIAKAGAPTPTMLVSGSITHDARAALADIFVSCRCLTDKAGDARAAMHEPLRWLRAIGRDIGLEWQSERAPCYGSSPRAAPQARNDR